MTATLILSCILLLLGVGSSHTFGQPQEPHSLWARSANISATNTNHKNITTAATITTAVAAFHCDYRGEDPDLCVASPFCQCGKVVETQSWPLLTPSALVEAHNIYLQCAYTAAPACMSCTSMGYYQGKCVSITDCSTGIASTTDFAKVTPSILPGTSAGSTNFTTGPITTAPLEISACKNVSSNSSLSGDTCVLQDASCSLQGSDHALDGLRDICVLWDSSCCGNSALAPKTYWNDHLNSVTSNTCFFDYSPNCTKSNPPGRKSAFVEFKDWMRSPQCFASNPLIAGDPNDAMVFQGEEFLNVTCCGDNCEIVADKVDVYYWPDPLADTSCLSIVGNGVSYVADGATTDPSGDVYWGCTVWGTGLGILDDQSSTVIRTATLSRVADILYKAYLVNPWDPSQCGNASESLSLRQNSTIQPRGIPATLRPRGHSLIVTGNGVSTTVLGNYTFTSPSIYVNFQGLHAGDSCGSTSIPQTMVAFSPGELSTITGQIGNLYATPQAFNPKDLPCPPYSIMSQNWYTPLPGVPYRPYFAFPEKLRQISDFKYCNAFYFSVFDPPRTLGPATAMVSDTTTVEPISPSTAPMPSSNAYQAARVTDHPGDPPQAAPQGSPAGPTAKISGDPSTQTRTPDSLGSTDSPAGENNRPPNGASSDPPQPPPKGSTKVPTGDPTATLSEDPIQGQSSKADEPTPSTNPTPSEPVANPPAAIQGPSDPNDESAAQMSALHQALGPAPLSDLQAQPTSNQHAVNQPSTDQPVSLHIQTGLADVPEPVLPASSDPASQNKGAPFTTIQVEPHPNSEPTNIYMESKNSITQDTLGPGANINDAFGTLVPITDAAIPVVTAADNILTASAPSAAPLAGKVPTPGGAEATIAGPLGSLALGGNQFVSTGPLDPNHSMLTAAGSTIGVKATSFNIAGTPIKAGEPGVTISGIVVSLGSENLFIGATAGAVQSAIITAGGQNFETQNAEFAIAGTTVAAEGPGVLFAGTPVSLGTSGILVVGSTTRTLAGSSPSSIFTVGGQAFTANPTGFTIAGTTFSAGGLDITNSGTLTSLDPLGSLHDGAITVALGDSKDSVFTTDGQTFTIEGAGQVPVRDTTLTNGGPENIINGVPMSVSSDVLVTGTNTVPSLPTSPTASVFTTDGQVLTSEGGGLVAVDGAILTNGGEATTISGIPMRVGSNALILGTNRVPLSSINGSISSQAPYAIGTDKPESGAASYGVRLLGVASCGFLIFVIGTYFG